MSFQARVKVARAGFAKGGATVKLEEKDGQTLLTYDVDAQVGGKLAQIGSRLIQSTARKMADDFFKKFAKLVTEIPAKPAAKTKKTAAEKSATKKSPAAASATEIRHEGCCGGNKESQIEIHSCQNCCNEEDCRGQEVRCQEYCRC